VAVYVYDAVQRPAAGSQTTTSDLDRSIDNYSLSLSLSPPLCRSTVSKHAQYPPVRNTYTHTTSETHTRPLPTKQKNRAALKKKRNEDFSMHAKISALERLNGVKRRSDELTIEEQVERFPFLKDAPLEGGECVWFCRVVWIDVGVQHPHHTTPHHTTHLLLRRYCGVSMSVRLCASLF
jgi:hypothetical protein